jgi:hypothetical protein
MTDEPLRMQILNMIERGDITAKEGLRWLEALAKSAPLPPTQNKPETGRTDDKPALGDRPYPESGSFVSEAADAPQPAVSPEQLPFDATRIRRWWVVPLWIGVGITVIAGMLMYWANQAQGIGFWFACASVPLASGLLLIVLAVQSRSARWLYLRVEQPKDEWPRLIQLGFPLPIRSAAWLFRLLKGRIPNLPDIAIDEILLTVGRNATPENPFYIQVDDDEDDEKVEIYIG